ncbi:MAG: hypothetical protein RJB39_630 [Candidatus Parcubacteria bacterium]|jgi:N6-L-threonylcarbamoyladenine synthase
MKDRIVLAIETSCDETAVALLSYTDHKYTVLAQELYSQIDIHKEYGGVFPMLAKREHGKNLMFLLEKALNTKAVVTSTTSITEELKNQALALLDRETELREFFRACLDNPQSFLYKKPAIEAIAVTVGPGLEPALWVGISFAKALAVIWDIELIPINHMEGHIASILIENEITAAGLFPSLTLLISGGHTEMVAVESWGRYNIIGGTKDDAVGEAYDKVARILGLEYPGGPAISAQAEEIRQTYTTPDAENLCTQHNIKLPRPMLHSQDTLFSFSGLKTAALYLVRDLKAVSGTDSLSKEQVDLICFEFEQSVVDVLIKKLGLALEKIQDVKTLIVGGGVIANMYIRTRLQAWCDQHSIIFLKPKNIFATDNAVMIGVAGLIQLNHGYATVIKPTAENLEKVVARGGWKVDEIY